MNTAATSGNTSQKKHHDRRKCTYEGCDNNVVQGGVCVTHGAKRKLCSFPDCKKAVQFAGYCSTHCPSRRIRRKCTHEGCDNHIIQGGVCVTHGATRKLCSFPDCKKAVKVAGYCSTHGRLVRKTTGTGATTTTTGTALLAIESTTTTTTTIATAKKKQKHSQEDSPAIISTVATTTANAMDFCYHGAEDEMSTNRNEIEFDTAMTLANMEIIAKDATTDAGNTGARSPW